MVKQAAAGDEQKRSNYRVVRGPAVAEAEISRSRFLACVGRVETETAATQLIADIRGRHGDANHNCFAWVIGSSSSSQRADDDGEPTGTAGRPILSAIQKPGLSDTVIVVTRYFGGIKLGASGLIRAYGQLATAAIRAAGVVERVVHARMVLNVDYSLLAMLENRLPAAQGLITGREYLDRVQLAVLVPRTEAGQLAEKIGDWTGGQVVPKQAGEEYVDMPVAEMNL